MICLCQGGFGLLGGRDDVEVVRPDRPRRVRPGGGHRASPRSRAAFAVRHLEDGETFDPATGVLHEHADGARRRRRRASSSTSGRPASPRASSSCSAASAGLDVDAASTVSRPAGTDARPRASTHPELLLVARRRTLETRAHLIACRAGVDQGARSFAGGTSPRARSVIRFEEQCCRSRTRRAAPSATVPDGQRATPAATPAPEAARAPTPSSRQPTRSSNGDAEPERARRVRRPRRAVVRRRGRRHDRRVRRRRHRHRQGRQDRQRRGAARHRLQVRGRHPVQRALDPQRRRPARGRVARRGARGARPQEGGQGRPPHPLEEARAVRARLGHDRGDQGEGRGRRRARSSRSSRAA